MIEYIKGSWHANPCGPGRYRITGNDEATIAYVEGVGYARLIASAPDLLAACAALLSDEFDNWDQAATDRQLGRARELARAALARVRAG